MPHLLSKLTKCIHRSHRTTKSVKPKVICEKKYILKFSRFELMPDEILLEIFQYISLIDLFNGFVNLNFRLNFLLRDIRSGICIDQNDDKINQSLFSTLYYFSNQITYIHVDRYPLLNLDIFPNLRSLIIYLPTTKQLLSINSKTMPYLSRLWLGIIAQKDQSILCNTLFGSEQFSKLYFCNLFEFNLNDNINSFQYSKNIRKLFITNCQTKDFILLLSLLPHLEQLEICLSNVLSTFSHNLTNFSHKNLRILKIEFAEKLGQLNILNSLISFVPYVQRCTLILINLIKIRDYAHLQNILIEKFLELREFICSIDYYCQLTSNEMSSKFQRLRTKLPFFQTMKVIPCEIHHNQCVRKTWINKTFIPIC
ncbi:unnamed protein product [Adineta steineri]|uniref:F-box domain-containing protein n=1 Tax=Adineta steineri TaxID=433720 RepID=A0A816B3A3_9BILA|nr:unnamed protein product [Adineta steineri]CAF1605398.1 unnamed protein product [Adineta steineri]